jgi:hypothetical protein
MKAFPNKKYSDGMDLRDYFAIHCLEQVQNITWNDVKEGLRLSSDLDIRYWTDDMTLLYKAKKRYAFADAMLKARELK